MLTVHRCAVIVALPITQPSARGTQRAFQVCYQHVLSVCIRSDLNPAQDPVTNALRQLSTGDLNAMRDRVSSALAATQPLVDRAATGASNLLNAAFTVAAQAQVCPLVLKERCWEKRCRRKCSLLHVNRDLSDETERGM